MKYIEAIIITESGNVEKVSAALDSIGIDSIAVKDPNDLEDIIDNKEKYRYDYIADDLINENKSDDRQMAEISFFLDDSEEGRTRLEEVYATAEKLKQCAAVDDEGAPQVSVSHSVVDDEDWKNKWKVFFKPARITDAITVCPTWEDYKPADGEAVIRIDPGMAFGTGTHETTSSCIILMEKYLKPEFKVLDVGCGSGILAIAAAFMGCSGVTGVDIDPDAVEAAKENVKINGVEDRVKILEGDLAEGLDIKADLIVANLTVNLIERLLADISAHMAADGIFVASGILMEQEQRAEEAMEAQGLEIVETLTKGDWCTIVSKRRTE